MAYELPGTKFLVSFIKNGGDGHCGFDAVGNSLQDAKIVFRSKDRNVGRRIREELIRFVAQPHIQYTMARVVGIWKEPSIFLNSPADYAKLHLQSPSPRFGQANTFDLQLIATWLSEEKHCVRIIVHDMHTNRYTHLCPLKISGKTPTGDIVERKSLESFEINGKDIVVVNRGNSHWLPTIYVHDKERAPLAAE